MMLFDSASDANPWKRSAPPFFIFNILTLCVVWIAFDIIGKEKYIVNYFLIGVPIFSVFLFFFGVFSGDVFRVRNYVLIIGIFGLGPIFISCSLPFFIFLTILKNSLLFKISCVGIYFITLFLSALISSGNIKKIEKKIGYLDMQISNFGENSAYIDPKKMKAIEFFIKKIPMVKTHEKIIEKLLPVAVLGYPLQRLVTDVGGHATTMAFLSIISVPLSLYMAGRLGAGYTLWVYLIGCHEKKIGARIFLSK